MEFCFIFCFVFVKWREEYAVRKPRQNVFEVHTTHIYVKNIHDASVCLPTRICNEVMKWKFFHTNKIFSILYYTQMTHILRNANREIIQHISILMEYKLEWNSYTLCYRAIVLQKCSYSEHSAMTKYVLPKVVSHYHFKKDKFQYITFIEVRVNHKRKMRRFFLWGLNAIFWQKESWSQINLKKKNTSNWPRILKTAVIRITFESYTFTHERMDSRLLYALPMSLIPSMPINIYCFLKWKQ